MVAVTNKAQNLNVQKVLTPYRVWVGEMETLGWTRPVHLKVGDDHVTFCGIDMSSPGYWWSNAYNEALTPEKQISCERCLKNLMSKQHVETLEVLLSV